MDRTRCQWKGKSCVCFFVTSDVFAHDYDDLGHHGPFGWYLADTHSHFSGAIHLSGFCESPIQNLQIPTPTGFRLAFHCVIGPDFFNPNADLRHCFKRFSYVVAVMYNPPQKCTCGILCPPIRKMVRHIGCVRSSYWLLLLTNCFQNADLWCIQPQGLVPVRLLVSFLYCCCLPLEFCCFRFICSGTGFGLCRH